MASIIVISEKHKGDFYRLGQRTNIIGRDEALPIQLIDDGISRRHMEIRFNQDKFTYSALDLGSKNGVLINGVKIEKELVLTDGDYITIGSTRLMFTLKDFYDRQTALTHAKKAGEQQHPTKHIEKK